MRLGDFILSHTDAILDDWDVFAREIWPSEHATPAALRDHAAEILRAAARDMNSEQTAAQQEDKSQGTGAVGRTGGVLDSASLLHAQGRVASGFSLPEVVAEYRALRASVIRLWTESAPSPDHRDLVDLTRFNETIDQSLTEAVRGYTGQVEQARRMFLAILGHDLRNPLTAIVMSAEALSHTATLDADSAESAARIATSGNVMGRMLADFLDFSQTQLGQTMPVELVATDLATLCNDVVDEIRASNPEHTIQLTTRGDLTGDWDPARIRQLISNLVGNAVQHGSATNPVEVVAEQTEREIRLTFRNHGTPIPADLLPRIFEPMSRGVRPEERTPGPIGSMGLGLYISREVATAHQGTISVQSTPDGVTTFTVLLPRRPAQSTG